VTLAALLVAAGRGRRLGAPQPKQYLPLGGGPCALRRSVDLFLSLPEVAWLAVAIHADDRIAYDAALTGMDDTRLLPPVSGGETRAASVRAGLEALEGQGPTQVLIHDAARPFVPPEVLRAVAAALGDSPGACAALPVVDALWRAEGGHAAEPVPRDGLWRAQTPQGFRFAEILAAHRAHDGPAVDDVAVARAAGLAVTLVPGSEDGFKITTPADLARADGLARLRDVASAA
jgi:2-C-methyl-D-erythritol 4-phosphate cytidylyltransferase